MNKNRRVVLIVFAVCVIVIGIWMMSGVLHRKSVERRAYHDIHSLALSQIESAYLTMRMEDDPDGRFQTCALTQAQTGEFVKTLSEVSQENIHCFSKWEESRLQIPYEQVFYLKMKGDEPWEWQFKGSGDGTFYLAFSTNYPEQWMSSRCKVESPALAEMIQTYF